MEIVQSCENTGPVTEMPSKINVISFISNRCNVLIGHGATGIMFLRQQSSVINL